MDRGRFSSPGLQTRFIVNPHSSGAARAFARVSAFASTLGAEVVLTTHPRHATELAARALADGCELIVAVGGDGTLNEVAASLVGTAATFGLIPCGSGNGLARHLGIPGRVEPALEILRTGQPRLIDTGLADGRPFFNLAGLGFEADLAARFNQLHRRRFFSYLRSGAALFRTHQPQECRIEHGGRSESARVFTLAVANGSQYGHHALIASGARVDDGLLDLTVVPPVTILRALPLLARLFTGSLGRDRKVPRLQTARFVVERPSPGLIHTDGETHSAGRRVEFTVRPRSLRVLAPATISGR